MLIYINAIGGKLLLVSTLVLSFAVSNKSYFFKVGALSVSGNPGISHPRLISKESRPVPVLKSMPEVSVTRAKDFDREGAQSIRAFLAFRVTSIVPRYRV